MRTIGIRHRRKRTTEGEARPTMVAIKEDDRTVEYQLEDDTAELDFVRGMFPIAWRDVVGDEAITMHQPRHCRWRLVPRGADLSTLIQHHLRERADGRVEICTRVPTTFDGLRPADRVAMVMGGSGDRLAAALSRRGDDINAMVYRIPPFALKEGRGTVDKEQDHVTLIRLLEEDLDAYRPAEHRVFYQVLRRDRDVIRVKETFQLRQDALKARIACEQRLQQRFVGRIFLSEQGLYPEGVIEDQADASKATDQILLAMLQAEDEQDRQLKQAVHALDIWQQILAPVSGCGSRIAAGLIAAIGTIQRFEVRPNLALPLTAKEVARRQQLGISLTEPLLPEEVHWRHLKAHQMGAARLKAFCGVHVLRGGKYSDVPSEKSFPRKRAGMVANWNALARQSLYLLGDQFNRKPKSDWGKKLLHYKEVLRQRHPEIITVAGSNGEACKKRYTNGHIHRMAIWRTLTKFVEWLFRTWTRLERQQRNATTT